MPVRTDSPGLSAGTKNRSRDIRLRNIKLSVGWFGVPALVALALISVYPLLVSVWMSLSQVDIRTINKSWPFVGLKNYIAVVTDPDFVIILWQTVSYVVIVVAIGLGGGLAAALVLKRGGRLVMWVGALMIFVWSLPPVVSGSLWKFSYADDGLINALVKLFGFGPVPWLSSGNIALFAVAIVNAWVAIPFTSAILRAALLDVPTELLEASSLDGAGRWQQFRYVVFPQLLPSIAVLSVLMVLNAFRSFDYIYVMTAGGPGVSTTTLPYLSYTKSFVTYRFDQGAAVAVIAVLIVLPISWFYLHLRRRENA